MGWRRRTWLLSGAVTVLLVALVAVEASGWRFLRQPLADALTRASGVPVTLEGAFALRLLRPPQMNVDRLRIGAAQDVPVDHLVAAEGLRLRWRWSDAWRAYQGHGVVIKSLAADTLDARLTRLPDGRASWKLGRSATPADEVPRPQIDNLHVRHASVKLQDEPTRTRALITLEGDAEGRAVSATAVGTYRALPLDLQARADRALTLLEVTADDSDEADVQVLVQGRVGASKLRFEGKAGSLLSARRLDGDLRFSGPSLAAVGDPLGITLPRTPAFDLQGRLAHDAGQWHLLARRFVVGRSTLAGDFVFDTLATPRKLSGKLTGSRLVLADLGPAIGAPGEGVGAQPKPAAPSRVLPNRTFDLPSLRAMQADVAVAIDTLDFGSQAIAPLRAVRTQVRLHDAVLHLNALSAEVAGGRISGSSSLDGRGDPARWAADLEFKGLDLAGWVRGVQTPAGAASAAQPTQTKALRQQRLTARQGGAQATQAYVTGELSAQWHLVGNGRSTAQILGSLDGRIAAMLRDGTVSHLATEAAGLDVAQALGVMVRGDRPLPLRCARADLVVQRGVATVQRAVVDNIDSTVNVSGQINLRDETLALKAVVRPKDISPFTLRTPLLVTGTLGSPRVGIQGDRLAGRALAAVALGAVAGPAALLPFIDLGSRSEGDPCANTVAAPR